MVTLQNLTELYPTMLDDNIVLPDGLEKETLKSVIMMRLGLCWPVYDEPEVFSTMLYSWFMSHYWNIERLVKVTETAYSPLENYDREESFTDTATGGSTTNDTNTNTANRTVKTDSETSGEGTSETDNDSENTNSVSAFNSSSFQNDNKSEAEGHQKTTTESSGSVDETRKETGTITDSRVIGINRNESNTRNGRIHGNIGVTTTQQMFSQELELLSGYNIYYTICNWIERDLFIQVY